MAGDTIDYTLLAANDGDVPLTAVNIADPNLSALTCTQPVSLAATEQLSCTGSYTPETIRHRCRLGEQYCHRHGDSANRS